MTTENGLFFLDSGSFSLWTAATKYGKKHGKSPWSYYDTKEFWRYMDEYAAFVKKYRKYIDYYANVDAIPEPELTWRNQQYLEKEHGLAPVPVVHFRTDLKWLRRYVRRGYEFIAIGGLVGSFGSPACRTWLDRVFDFVCDTPKRLPKVKLHGFAVTGYECLLRYPWWSVDSATWTKVGAFGGILLPHKRGGRFTYETEPYQITMSQDAPTRAKGKHYSTLSPGEQRIVREWLKQIGVPLGKNDKDGNVIEHGVINRHSERKIANLLFFEGLRKWLSEYPWPFKPANRRPAVGFFSGNGK